MRAIFTDLSQNTIDAGVCGATSRQNCRHQMAITYLREGLSRIHFAV